ncbi:MAG: NAD(P)H-hydrate dehydratase [Nanoarchaeota archaeon]|nr:NAD(P)H-hydrate dehydratase [Nanoarchaeota archaeon]
MKVKDLMKRKKTSHKGENGFVLVVGGSEDYTGTLVLVGLAALRSGCDLVTVCAPEKVAWAINALSSDLVTKKLPGKYLKSSHLKTVLGMSKKFDVIEIGNGIGLKKETKVFVKKLVKKTKNKLKVIDADAIKLLSLKEIDKAIITPHGLELEILLKNSKIKRKMNEIRKHLKNNVLVIKGATDYIVSKNKITKVKGGNPGMTKAGTGDVLAGLCAGFLAQTGDLFKSAAAASRVSKQIGNILLKKKKGYVFLASDMVKEIKKLR